MQNHTDIQLLSSSSQITGQCVGNSHSYKEYKFNMIIFNSCCYRYHYYLVENIILIVLVNDCYSKI